jgi:DNA invertase Pin-like site-specific DNA recombinase
MTLPERAAIYVRVSTDRQELANQEAETRQLCEARGWRDPVIFREIASGAKRRPEWDSVLEAARTGNVGAVVFWSIDRIGRNKVQAAHDLRRLLDWRVAVASVRESWLDTPGEDYRGRGANPARDLLIDVITWVAEGERQRLIERTHAGLARARARGRVGGRPSTLDPAALERALQLRDTSTYNPKPPHRVIPGPLGWRAVARFLQGEGFGTIAPSTLASALRRRSQNGSRRSGP